MADHNPRASSSTNHKLSFTVSGINGQVKSPANPRSIQDLPEEVFASIVQPQLNDRRPIEHIQQMATVCRRWRAVVVGTPSLWSCLRGEESLQLIQKALEMSQNLLLDIDYYERTARTNPLSFLTVVGRHLVRWKSANIVVNSKDISFADLEVRVPQNLQKLRIRRYSFMGEIRRITLSGGAPAPRMLKEIDVGGFNIDLCVLNLTRMRTIKLGVNVSLTANDLISMLQSSKELEGFALSRVEIRGNHDPITQQVQLPFLRTMSFWRIPQAILTWLLPNISTPRLEELGITTGYTGDGPIPVFFPIISAFTPTVKSMISRARSVELELAGFSFGCKVGELSLSTLSYGLDGGAFALELLELLKAHFEARYHDLPFSLTLDSSSFDVLYDEWLSTRVRVTKLTLLEEVQLVSTRAVENQLRDLSRPLGPIGWLLPDLEILETNVAHKGLIDVVRARRSPKTKDTPTPLREVRLVDKERKFEAKQDPGDKEMMQVVRTLSRDIDIYWEGEKWTEED